MVKENANPKDEPIKVISQKESKCFVRFSISQSTKDLVMQDCKSEFMTHHPELDGMKITENFLIRQIAKFYLKNP